MHPMNSFLSGRPKPLKKINTLIMDAGGVLVHPVHGDWNIPVLYEAYLGDYARDIPGEAWLEACRAEAALLREDVFIEDMEQEFELRRSYLENIAARLGWQLDADVVKALALDFTWNTARYQWYPDVMPWLSRWHGRLHMGILSDAMPSFRYTVELHPSRQLLDALVVSTEIGACKPDSRMYAEICRRMNVRPADCLFVDDKPCNLTGAMEFGMQAVQMCRDALPAWDGPRVHNLSELNAYMEELN